MSRHKRFADNAGYTRHCWECTHAKEWKDTDTIKGKCATCELTGVTVYKHDSPNNPCCHLPIECKYETEVKR